MQPLAELCVRKPALAYAITCVMVAAGVVAFLNLGVSRYPDVALPILTIATPFPGASPEQIESDITRRIEHAVSGLDGIEALTSRSAAGYSVVIVRFVIEKNAGVAAREVEDKVRALTDLPAGAGTPQVLRFDPNQIPIAVVALSGQRPVSELSDYAEGAVRPAIERLPGVARVNLVGGQTRQVNVEVAPTRLAAHGVTVTALLNAIQTRAGGTDDSAQRAVPLAFNRMAALANVPLGSRAGRPIRLAEVARVEPGVARPQTATNVDGTPALLLYVQKQSAANTVGVVTRVRDRLRTLQQTAPPAYSLRVVWDQAEYVVASTDLVEHHLIAGALLAASVALVFLGDWRATGITALAIPISLISTFVLLAALHLTLNTFTLLALALVVGIVIDDAIVVLENIYRLIRTGGLPPVRAAVEGTREVGTAVMATTLSLIVVFLPLAFMGGIVGRFMSSFGWTMACAIAVSLLVSFTLTPALASRWLGFAHRASARTEDATAPGRMEQTMERSYRWMLERSLRRRWVLVALSVLALASILPLWRSVSQDFLPVDDESQFEVAGKAPGGSTLAGTAAVATQMAAAIRHLGGVTSTVVAVGDDPQHSPETFTLFVHLVPVGARVVTQQQEMARVRTDILPPYQARGVTATVNNMFDLTGSVPPLEYVISGPDLTVLKRASDAAVAYLSTVPGVADVRTSLATGASWDVRVNPAQAGRLGVGLDDAADTILLLSRGIDVRGISYARDGRFYGVHVEADNRNPADPAALLETPLASTSGRTVPLRSVIDIRRMTGPTEIDHFNRERAVTISANLLPGTFLGTVTARLGGKLRALGLPPGYYLGPAGVSEQVSRTERAFARAFAIAFALMFLVLAALFKSWLHPITILASLPLTVPFALISILLLRGSLNPLSYLGILVLFGVVKKNAILQVDRANQLRAQGVDKNAAIVRASVGRLRPILMTTIAFVAGAVPLAVSRGVGTATSHTISAVIIGGQTLSLLLTLVAVPVFYSLFDDLETRLTRRRARPQDCEITAMK